MSVELKEQLINTIYEAALDDALWDLVLKQFSHIFNSHTVTIHEQHHNNTIGHYLNNGMPEKSIHAYENYYAFKNPFFEQEKISLNKNFACDLAFEKMGEKKFINYEYYYDWLRHVNDTRHVAGTLSKYNDHGMLVISLFRDQLSGHFSAQDLQFSYELSQHIARAFSLRERYLHKLQYPTKLNPLFEHLYLGVIYLDNKSKIDYINDQAKSIINNNTSISIINSELKLQHTQRQADLTKCIHNSLKNKKLSILKHRSLNNESLSVTILPYKQQRLAFQDQQQGVVILLTDDNKVRNISPEFLMSQWQLTLQEAIFTAHLLAGLSLKQIAEKMGIKESTSRWYSKQVMEKLAVKRQSDIILKIYQSSFIVF